ncbi:unnamed protein product, partial [marine sediment metagenome]
ELAVVGLQEGAGERVACLVVPDYEKNEERSREEVRTKVEEHIQQVSRKLPLYKRIKTFHITDEELPRTATKKVKRREVVEILHRLKQEAEAGGGESGDDIDGSWLLDVVATICEKPRSSIYMDTRMDELGFDSLMYTELAAAIEAAGSESPQPDILKNLADLRELAECLKCKPGSRKEVARASESKGEKQEAVNIPPLLAEMGRKGLTAAQRWFFKDVLKPEFKGRANVPQHTHFIVV